MSKRKDHEGLVRQRPSGLWEVQVQLNYKRVSLYGRSQAEVLAKLKTAKEANDSGRSMLPDRSSVGGFLELWLETIKTSARPKTFDSYESVVRVHLKPLLGKGPLVKLNAAEIQAMVNKLAQTDRAGVRKDPKAVRGKLSARTVEYCVLVLRRALNLAVEWGLITKNPALAVKVRRVTSDRAQYFDVEQAQALLGKLKGKRLEALYSVAIAVGLRRGEALGLRWSDVDLDSGVLTIRNQLQRVQTAAPGSAVEPGAVKSMLTLSAPKTKNSRRTIELPEIAVEALRAHRKAQDERAVVLGDEWKATGFVFTTKYGGMLEPRSVTRHFAATLKSAGLPPMRFHDLRHTCASLMLAQGVHPRVVMEVLGHSSIGVTMDTYSHVMPAVKREVAQLMDGVLRKRAEAAG